MNDKQRYRANEEPLAEQTMRVLESQTNGSGSQDDQATAELGRLLRDAAKANLPESNVDLREQLMAELDGGAPDEQVTVTANKVTASKLASESTGHRRFWIAAAASGLLLVGGAIAYNSDFVGEFNNVALLKQPRERLQRSADVANQYLTEKPSTDYLRAANGSLGPDDVSVGRKGDVRVEGLSPVPDEYKPAVESAGGGDGLKVRVFSDGEIRDLFRNGTFENGLEKISGKSSLEQLEPSSSAESSNGKIAGLEKALASEQASRAQQLSKLQFDLSKAQSDFSERTEALSEQRRISQGQAQELNISGMRLAGQDKSGRMKLPGDQQPGLLNMAGEAISKKPAGKSANGIVGQFSGDGENFYRNGGPSSSDGQAGAGDIAGGQLFDSNGEANELKPNFAGQGLPVDAPTGRLTITGDPNAVEDGRRKAQRQLAIAIREATAGGGIDQRRGGGRPAEFLSGGEVPFDPGQISVEGRSPRFLVADTGLRNEFGLGEGKLLGLNGQILAERRTIDELELQRDQLLVTQRLGPGHSNISVLALEIEDRKQKLKELMLGEPNTGEQYEPIFENAFIAAKGPEAISTFSIDVDTASYANMRRLLNSGQRPPANSIRLEELVNYFQYDYKQPTGEHPFSVNLDLADCPWQDGHQLLRVGLKGKAVHVAERPATNVVFLIDVSGSMSSNDKLPLLKSGFQMMSQQLGENDRVSIVTYAGNAGVVLTPTNGTQTKTINDAIERLSSGGSTHGSAGIKLAYQLAQQNFIEGGVNRVMLATDGDLNVGVTSDDALVSLIKQKASEGVFLTVLGFGTGNLKDGKLEKLTDNGNGMYAYIDSTREARRVLVDQLSGSLVTIAKDVKIQVEFNPAEVKSYRLLGYENRMLETKDFDDDRKDAGEIGAGHTVTAIYQIESAKPVKRTVALPANMKYQVPADVNSDEPADEADDAGKDGLSKQALSGDLATVALRYKEPEASESVRLEVSIKNEPKRFEEASDDFRFAASVAGFGMYLRNSKHRGTINAALLQRIASGAIGSDESGYRSEFIDLIRKASGR